MADYTEIIINWESRQRWDEKVFRKIGERNVLYSIYCDSHIYGRDVLAYIGKTNQRFQDRLDQHEKSFFKFADNLNYSIGVLEESFSNQLEIPESILIANHKPFFNKEFIHDIHNEAKKRKIIIINNGNHGTLKNACTNFWWVEKQ